MYAYTAKSGQNKLPDRGNPPPDDNSCQAPKGQPKVQKNNKNTEELQPHKHLMMIISFTLYMWGMNVPSVIINTPSIICYTNQKTSSKYELPRATVWWAMIYMAGTCPQN
ncbi:hypothetical protein EDD16DRAFT_1521368 [Pisolithus croceorrhizus]|nr:hypothetical protein EV401DRAFT_1894092 [Pisolithus croceorrhizus]KAI6113210.1 hypothetical protein EDD16DRAFT_1521368 [Pisolithus croceorrhizus]